MSNRLPAKIRGSRYGAPLLLGILTLSLLTLIEMRYPYFFLQDDNRDYHLPYMIHNFRALLAGEIPLFNFHQYLGTPILSCVESAALYPINYLAVCLSKLLLGHYFATIEFVAMIHLLMASIGFFYFMRHFELKESACCLGALAWTFCGFVISVGNSWVQVLGYAAYVPWIFLFSVRQLQTPHIQGFIVLVLCKVLALLLGYPQLFVYTATFDAVMIMALYMSCKPATDKGQNVNATGAGHVENSLFKLLMLFILNYVCALIIALPILLPAWHQVGISAGRRQIFSWPEYVQFSYSISHWFNGLVTPFLDMPVNSWFDPHFISHVGYLTIVCIFIALFTKERNARYVYVFSALAMMAFLWASNSVVTRFFYHLPLFNGFRWPFKLGFFVSFFLVTIATFGFDTLLNKISTLRIAGRSIANAATVVLFVLHAANFLLLYTFLPQHMFSRHLDAVPFDEPFKAQLSNGRIVSIGLPIEMDGEKRIYGKSVPLLGFNYATLFELFQFGGYEALISSENSLATMGLNERSLFTIKPGVSLNISSQLPLEYFRDWGVTWYIVDRRVAIADESKLTLYAQDDVRSILFDSKAKPLVYWADRSQSGGILHELSTNTILITTKNENDGALVVNVLYNKFFKATIDGLDADVLETDNSKMLVKITKGNHSINITYRDPYFVFGSIISVSFLFVAVMTLLFMQSRSGRLVKE